MRNPVDTIETLRARCDIAEVSGCWLWTGAAQRDYTRMRPVVWLPMLGGTISCRRAAWLLSGRAIRNGHLVWSTCGVDLCCNPDHLMAGTMAQRGAWQRKHAHHIRGPHRSLASSRAYRRREEQVLTPELAQWARESGQVLHEVAHAFACHFSTISRVRRGQVWLSGAPGSSVFARGA